MFPLEIVMKSILILNSFNIEYVTHGYLVLKKRLDLFKSHFLFNLVLILKNDLTEVVALKHFYSIVCFL